MPITQLTEKPGGARNVVSWDLIARRDYRPVYLLSNKRAGYQLGAAQNVVVTFSVTFDDDESAREFEAKVRALLPEVATA